MAGPVAVVALGELARSPRMLNHAWALAGSGCGVVLIGYGGRGFDAPPGVQVVLLDGGVRAPETAGAALFLARSGWRMSMVFQRLYRALVKARPAQILVQNPPSFPTLLAAWLAARRSRARLVVDWHNYGHSLLGLRLGPSHVFARLATRYEGWAGRRADTHFCVSEAFRADLAARHRIAATVLYDRPLVSPPDSAPPAGNRLVCVCPAGWTADEDVPLLLDSLELLSPEEAIVYITGDGPTRAALESRMARLRRRGVLVTPGFLPGPEYRKLLAEAGVGISVHRSSSGLDLAMKVVDIFGAGAPCCVLASGTSLSEQVEEGVTGFHFRDSRELARILAELRSRPERLAAARRIVRERWGITWSMEWDRVARRVLTEAP
jgi:beta-1,4-mannosyltransferase